MLRFITTYKMYGVKVKIKVFILIFCVSSAVTQTSCDSSSDVTQCSEGEICRNNVCEDASCISASDTTQCSEGEICRNNVCEGALYCELGGNAHCASGLACRADYCQPYYCTSTGQCVHGQVCSQDTNWGRRCVYPVVHNIQEGSEFTFAFQESGTPGSYKQILWYKGGKNFFNRIAAIHPIITDNETLYWHQFCSANSPCGTSDRAHLNISTGELTIHSVELSDEGLYYYKFVIAEGVYVPAVKYEYKLNIYVTGNNHVMITGCVIGALVLVALVIVGVNVCKRYKVKFYLKFHPRSERVENVSTVDNVVDNGGYDDPVNNNANPYEEVDNGINNGNQYQEVNNGGNIGNQYDVINGGNNGNQYDVINEDAMAVPRGAGFVNLVMATYEEVL